MITSFMLIIHTLGDFFLQSDDLVNGKQVGHIKAYIKHFLAFLIPSMTILIFIDYKDLLSVLSTIAIIFISHILIDILKEHLNKQVNNPKLQLMIFVFDQLLHLFIIVAITNHIKVDFNAINGWFITTVLKGGLTLNEMKVFATIFYIAASGMYFIPLVFKAIYSKDKEEQTNHEPTPTDDKEIKTGKWIGFFERFLIVFCLVIKEYNAIGFIVALKSLARFKQMDDKDFAEYYLIGTLSSIVYTLTVFVILQKIL